MTTPTLRTLLRHPELHLALETPEASLPAGALDRPLRWVHSSDLSDPTPFLADDLALLTTGTQFAQRGPAHQIEYVARLARRGVTALGFGTDVALPEIPRALRQACADTGIPLFEVPYGTPFIAIARAHAELIAAPQGARSDEVRSREQRLRAQLLASLLLDDPHLAQTVLGALPPAPFVVAVAEPDAPSDSLSRWWKRSAQPQEAFAAEADAGYTMCITADRAELIDEAVAQTGIRIGVSSPAGYEEFSRAHGEALAALRRGGAGATRFADTEAASLRRMLANEETQRAASSLLAPVRDAGLEHTLRVWLGHDARLESAATELGIHRHTLRTRIAQASKLLDRDLGTFPARAELWAALQAAAPRR